MLLPDLAGHESAFNDVGGDGAIMKNVTGDAARGFPVDSDADGVVDQKRKGDPSMRVRGCFGLGSSRAMRLRLAGRESIGGRARGDALDLTCSRVTEPRVGS